MFFFGLFSTHLPYIILSVIYLMGLGVFSANAFRAKDHTTTPEAKVITVNIKKPQLVTNKTFFVSYKIKVKEKPLVANNSTIFYFHKPILQKTIFKEFYYCYLSYYNFSIFSRPPPVYC
jgi:hypothetical protein